GQELLRHGVAGQRPEPRARSAAQHDGVVHRPDRTPTGILAFGRRPRRDRASSREQPHMANTAADLRAMKAGGQPITMVTAYDYPTARLVDAAGVDAILVGDTLGMVVLGHGSTVPVTMADMLHHLRAVARGASRALVVGDMPFLTYQVT